MSPNQTKFPPSLFQNEPFAIPAFRTLFALAFCDIRAYKLSVSADKSVWTARLAKLVKEQAPTWPEKLPLWRGRQAARTMDSGRQRCPCPLRALEVHCPRADTDMKCLNPTTSLRKLS